MLGNFHPSCHPKIKRKTRVDQINNMIGMARIIPNNLAYLIFVTTITTAGCVNNFANCKIFQLEFLGLKLRF